MRTEENATAPGTLIVTTSNLAGLTETTMVNTGPSMSSRENNMYSEAGPSQQREETPSARQLDDLNFYLRRLSIGGNHDMAQIESFGGGSDYEMFLDAVNSVGRYYGWSEQQILRMVEMKLKDKAREYYGALLPNERPKTLENMKDWFRSVFGRKLTINAGKRELERCIRHPGEPLGEYAQRLKVIANKMFPASRLTTPGQMYHRNLLLVNQFIEGLEGRLANEVLREGEFFNLDDCLAVAERREEIVSRMIPETKYDARMSVVRRVDVPEIEPRRAGQRPTLEEARSRRVTPYEEELDEFQIGSLRRPTHDSPARERSPPPASRRFGSGRYQDTATEVVGYDTDVHPRDNQRRGDGSRNRRGSTREYQPRTRADWPERNRSSAGLVNGGPRRTLGQRRMVNRVEANSPSTTPLTEMYPYMKNRCLRCGQEGHLARGCTSPKKLFCFHCGREGEICSLNSQGRMATHRR